MDADHAQLSSIASALDDLTRRVVAIADQRAVNPRDSASGDLYDVERHLSAATRRLATLLRRMS